MLTRQNGSPNCGMTVRRITDREEVERKDATTSSKSVLDDPMADFLTGGHPAAPRKRERWFDDDEEVARFRRVRIVCTPSYVLAAMQRSAMWRKQGLDPNIQSNIWRLYEQLYAQAQALAQKKAAESHAMRWRALEQQFREGRIKERDKIRHQDD